jgi:hypothetical protein
MPRELHNHWDDTIAFYRGLIDQSGWQMQPMLDFVYWLASGPYGRVLFPSTSHAALGLATVPTYEERLDRPMVYIEYVEPGKFVVHWQRGQGHDVHSEPVASPQAPEVFGRILGWLGVSDRVPA